KLAVGMIVRLVRGVEIVAIARTAGFDCLFIDTEHNDFSLATVTQLCLAANMAGITPLVRVSGVNETEISHAFDCGAMGVIVPAIKTARDARNAVAAARFPPAGNRSIMPCLPHLEFRPAPAIEAMRAVNEATLVVAMIESIEAVDAVEEIAAVEGLDMLLVGGNDLANALKVPGELDHPDIRAAIERVATACDDPPPLNGSTLKYGFDHEGGPQWQTSDTSPTRSSRSFGRLRFCAAKAWRWRMPF